MMSPEEYVHLSGGANGSDEKFDTIGREFGIINHTHYWYKKMNPFSLPEHEITEEQYLEGVRQVYNANRFLKRKNIEQYMHLLARNWMQVKNAEAVFAVSTIKNNIVEGGTGWATMFAIINNKPLYVFEQEKNNWYYWNNKFEICVTPTLTQYYAGIGTRKINENGINAIINIYKKTFKHV